MSRNKKLNRNLRKKKRIKKQNIRKAKHRGWEPPKQDNCIIYVGFNKNGTHLVDSKITQNQIQFLMAKECKIVRNDQIYDLDEIFIETRNPVSLDEHRIEHGQLAVSYIKPLLEQKNIMHFEILKNNMRELHQTKLKTFSLLEYISEDRKLRIDQFTVMSDMPPLVAITLKDGCICRLEFCMGHNKLEKKIELLAIGMNSQDMSNFPIEKYSYDVANNEYWMANMIGLKLEDYNYMEESIHEALFADFCKIKFIKNNSKAA
jgi:hypothetical protein